VDTFRPGSIYVGAMDPTAAAWFARRTSSWRDWPRTVRPGPTVSVVLPALDEEPTVGTIVAAVRAIGGIDEVVVIDDGSTDGTAKAARDAGAVVHHKGDILPEVGTRPGKGESLWKALAVTSGDLIVYVDADLTDFRPHFVTGLLGPLLHDPTVGLVKAFYDRPLLDVSASGGGRVTELTARPLLNAYFPELAGVVQPLAGEYAARRTLLEELPFAAGYGVETALLIDTVRRAGLDAVAQVDLGQRTHGHQDTAALGRMAAAILQTVMARADPGRPLGRTLTQFHREGDTVVPVETELLVADRPPMTSVAGYRPGSGS
jgi:glucosyl-3-phosphoglycerate synthase